MKIINILFRFCWLWLWGWSYYCWRGVIPISIKYFLIIIFVIAINLNIVRSANFIMPARVNLTLFEKLTLGLGSVYPESPHQAHYISIKILLLIIIFINYYLKIINILLRCCCRWGFIPI